MALKIVKGSIDRMFDKNLQDLVRGIRNHKEDEVKRPPSQTAPGLRAFQPALMDVFPGLQIFLACVFFSFSC